jgi:hypothetical protein
MTPEQQRIAIAEVCGWSVWSTKLGEWTLQGPGGRRHERFTAWDVAWSANCIPDYLNDLNCIHEAEKMLGSLDSKELYAKYLISIVLETNEDGIPATRAGCFAISHATAAQRAEAFLKAKGLWK